MLPARNNSFNPRKIRMRDKSENLNVSIEIEEAKLIKR